jgi:cytochrome c553
MPVLRRVMRRIRVFPSLRVALALPLIFVGESLSAAGPDQAESIAKKICAECHGEDGNSPIPFFPKLAGLQPEYIAKELTDFMSGERKNDLMAPLIGGLQAQDVVALGRYFAGQRMAPGGPGNANLAKEGQRIFSDGNEVSGVPACAGCHQPDGLGRSAGGPNAECFPRLAGQNAPYIAAQLLKFKEGARANDSGRLMRTVAGRLTNEEIKAVAEFNSGM